MLFEIQAYMTASSRKISVMNNIVIPIDPDKKSLLASFNPRMRRSIPALIAKVILSQNSKVEWKGDELIDVCSLIPITPAARSRLLLIME